MHELDPEIDQLSLLKFKDFVPNQKSYNIWTGRSKIEPLSYALQDANSWIARHPNIELINIETVVLPNIHSSKEEGSQDPELRHDASMAVNWYQFIRVWYIQKPR